MQHITLEDTVYFHFSANDAQGAAADPSDSDFLVRECGGGAGDAPVYSGAPTLLTHGDYPDGALEIAIPATAANGFEANKTYAVFARATVDGAESGGLLGHFRTAPVPATLSSPKAEPTSKPAAGASLDDKLAWLFVEETNERSVQRTGEDTAVETLRNDADDADIGTRDISDNGFLAVIGKRT